MPRIATSRPPLGTQSHLSSGRGMDDDGGVRREESLDTGGGWSCTRASTVGVPTRHEAVHLRALLVWGHAMDGRMARAGAEATLSALGTVARTVVGENFPTLVTEAGVRGDRAAVWVWPHGVKGVFIGE